MIGLDKICLIADADEDIRIIGYLGKRNHDKMSGDCRASATMCCTGTSGGSNAPTVFFIKGKNRRGGFPDEYIVKSGCAVGSKINMT